MGASLVLGAGRVNVSVRTTTTAFISSSAALKEVVVVVSFSAFEVEGRPFEGALCPAVKMFDGSDCAHA
jgi:hypothetical protein